MNTIVVYYSSKGSNEYLAKKISQSLSCEIESILGDKCVLCQAFPVGLVLPDDKKEDPDAFMKTHLNDENFKGEIQEIYKEFIGKVINPADP